MSSALSSFNGPCRTYPKVGTSFHLKPLIRAYQFSGRFQILCLTQRSVKLYEGDQDRLNDVVPRHVPTSVYDVPATEMARPHRRLPAGPGASLPLKKRFRSTAIFERWTMPSGKTTPGRRACR